ncbi:MAG: HEAT repeat domain-containing protein [Candidatus Scalinduaceae bacterium]
MKKAKKKISIYSFCLNPGLIFLVLLLATGVLIVKHKAEDKALDVKISERKTLGSLSPVVYKEVNSPDNIRPVSIAGKDNLYSDDKIKEDDNNLSTSIRFKDVTLESGIEFSHTQGGKMLNAISEVVGSGVCMADYDNDGFVDIYAVNGAGYTHFYGKKWWWYKDPYNTLYHNNGDGTFTDVTEKAGVGDSGWGMGCAFGDYDNDGNPDLYVTNYGANILYHNNGDGTFTDVTEEAGVGDEGWGTSLAWGDYDNDGDLDIYIANYLVFDKTMNPGEPNSAFRINMPLLMNSKLFDGQRNVLYRNNGDGTFTDVTNEAGVGNSPGKSMGVVFFDFNDDGYQDIYIANDKSRNVLYLNNGTGTFTDIGGALGADSPLSGMGVTVGDYDNDGDMDVFSTYTQKDTNILYKNTLVNGTEKRKEYSLSKFVDATMNAGLGEDVSVGYFGWGTEFFDYDNDGYIDLFVANGHGMPDFDNPRSTIGQRNQLFRNSGDGSFLDVSSRVGYGLRLENSSRGVTMGDYDNDGDIDIFVINNNNYATLLQNVGGNTNNWLNIELIGIRSNRDAIGARVKVVAGPLSETKEVRSGSGYLSQSDTRLNFGLGGFSRVDLVEVRWPSGITESFRDVKTNQFMAIVEGEKKFNVANTIKKTGDLYLSGAVSPQIDMKMDVNSAIKQQALIALGNIGDERALKPLLICLRDKNAGVRREAVKALRYFDSDRAIEPIIMALADSDVGVRREAAATLGYLLKAEQTIRKASIQRKRLGVPPLLRALEDEDSIVRREAVKALGFSESYRACIPVTRMLDDNIKKVRKDATITLGLLRDRRAIEPLIEILKDTDEEASIRAEAVISLNRLESKIAMEPLLKALKDEDSKIRRKAASVFVALFEDDEGVVFRKKQAIEPLLEALNDGDPLVRREVVKALGLIKDRQVTEHLMRSLTDEDSGVRQTAIKSLRHIVGKDAVPDVVNALGDENYKVRTEAILTLCTLGDNEVIPYLMNALKDDNVEVRRQAVISMGTFGDKKVIEVLLKVIKDENENQYVRLSAFSSLNKIGKDTDPKILIDLLENSNYEIRKEATRCLGVLKDKGVIESLINKLTDEDKEVRREAVLALGGYKDNRVFDALVKILLDTNENDLVRSGAVLSLSRLGNRKALLHLVKVLRNRGDNVRLEVVKALGAFNDELAIKQLMMIIKNRHEDSLVRSKAVMAMSQMDSEKVVETLINLIRPLS